MKMKVDIDGQYRQGHGDHGYQCDAYQDVSPSKYHVMFDLAGPRLGP